MAVGLARKDASKTYKFSSLPISFVLGEHDRRHKTGWVGKKKDSY